MINLISGANGSGKTQRLIDAANTELDNTNGLIVYIDYSNNHRLGIDNRIRFINASEFDIDNADKFAGMLCGVISGNYDINRVFVDNLNKIVNSKDIEVLKSVFREVEKLKLINEVEFTFTFNSEYEKYMDPEDFKFI